MRTLHTSFTSLLKAVADPRNHDDLAVAAVCAHLSDTFDLLDPTDAQILSEAIDLTEKEYCHTKKLLRKMDYDGMHKQLEDMLTSMERMQNPLDKRKQATRCIKTIYSSFTTLWCLGVEQGRYRGSVRQYLLLYDEVIARIMAHPGSEGGR